jgi:EmrB/QacA subfamily drug resistance transporter
MEKASHQWRILAVLCLAVLLVAIDNTIVNVALPTISRNLHASNSALQWIVDGYSLPFAALMLAGGGFGDRWGRRRVMALGLLFFSAFSLLATFSHTVSSLIAARSLMGVSAAFILPATLSIVTVTFKDAKQRAVAFGIWGAAVGIAIAVGPIAGGELITHFWFGSVFLVNVPLGVLSILALWLVVPESRTPRRRRFDVVGLTLGTVAVTSLTLAIIEGPSWGWRSGSTLSLFAAAVVALAWFVRYESRHESPLFEVRIFTNRAFSAGALSIVVNYFLLMGFIFLVTQYFQSVRGYSALSAGLRTLPFAGTVMATTPLGAILAARVGARYVVPTGMLLMSGALAWMTTQGVDSAYFGPVVGSMVVLAIGFSLISAPSTAVTMGALPPHQVGAGAAVNETNRELGGTLGVAVIGSVFSSLFGPAVRRALSPYLAHGLSSQSLTVAQSSMQAATSVVSRLPVASQSLAHQALTSAFMQGFHRACLVAAGIGVVTAAVTFLHLPRGPLAQIEHPLERPDEQSVHAEETSRATSLTRELRT